MRNVFVKIAVAGNILRDPVTKAPLSPNGEWKPANNFWLRCIASGDVVEDTQQQTATQAAAAKAPVGAPRAVMVEAPADQASTLTKGPRNATQTSNAS
jgi:hypothetical protein